jgi:hypothetical protein
MKKFAPLFLLFLCVPAFKADSAVILFGRTQNAIQTPFEPGRNPDFNGSVSPFTATDVQNAIEESYYNAPGNAARSAVTFGAAGNSNNKYLEFFRSVPSNSTPHVIPRDADLTDITCATSDSSTNQFEIRINGSIVFTLNKTGITEIASMNISVLQEDTLSLRIANGAGKDPVCTVFYKILLEP